MRRRIFLLSLAALATFVYARSADVRLSIAEPQLAQLRQLRAAPKFTDLPGAFATDERQRLEPLLDALLDRLIAGIRQHPSRDWVLAQMDPFVAAFHLEDTELRERCRDYLDAIFRILGMPGDGGAFIKYLLF